jgi:hypothetical protein
MAGFTKQKAAPTLPTPAFEWGKTGLTFIKGNASTLASINAERKGCVLEMWASWCPPCRKSKSLSRHSRRRRLARLARRRRRLHRYRSALLLFCCSSILACCVLWYHAMQWGACVLLPLLLLPSLLLDGQCTLCGEWAGERRRRLPSAQASKQASKHARKHANKQHKFRRIPMFSSNSDDVVATVSLRTDT